MTEHWHVYRTYISYTRSCFLDGFTGYLVQSVGNENDLDLNWHLAVFCMDYCRKLEFDLNNYDCCVKQRTLDNDTEVYMDNFRNI